MKCLVPIFFILVSCTGKTPGDEITVIENEKKISNNEADVFYSNLSNSLKNADSIIVASHKLTNYPQRDKQTGKTLPPPELIMNGRANDAIIHEWKRLTKEHILKLDSILTATAVASEISTACFQPRHVLFIYRKGKLSYLDFCFDCYGYSASGDLKSDLIFDDSKWDRLREFYKGQGFKYEL